MVGLREGRQSGQQDLQVAETLQQMKIPQNSEGGGGRQVTAPRKVQKFDKAKEVMFVCLEQLHFILTSQKKGSAKKGTKLLLCDFSLHNTNLNSQPKASLYSEEITAQAYYVCESLSRLGMEWNG